MIAPFLQLDHRAAAVTPLPASRLGHLNELAGRRILRAFARLVGSVVALAANARPAAFALPDAATCGTVGSDVRRFDPRAAVAGGAVDAVAGGILLEFVVPGFLEGLVEELVDMFEGDVVRGAATRGHVRGVGDGHGEDSSEAGVAHAVGAGEFGGTGEGDSVVAAGEAGGFLLGGWGARGDEGGEDGRAFFVGVKADGRFCDADFSLRAWHGSRGSLIFWSRLVTYACSALSQKRTDDIRRGSPAAQSQHTMQHDLSLAYLSGVLRSSIPNEFRRRTGSVFLLVVPRRSSVRFEM